jgi:hypothetical protein
MAGIPEGWTDDMSVPLPAGRSAADVAKFVIDAGLQGVPDVDSEQLLMVEFSLTAKDAALARDRTFGGLFRSGTGNPLNCPSRDKDPIAWEGYQIGKRDPTLFAHFFPRFKGAVESSGNMRYSLRALLILLAILPPVLAVGWWSFGTDRLQYIDAIIASIAFLSLGYIGARLVERLRRPT